MASRRWAVEIPAHRRSAEDNSARAGGRQGPSTARRVGRLLKDLTASQRLGLMQKRRVAAPPRELERYAAARILEAKRSTVPIRLRPGSSGASGAAVG